MSTATITIVRDNIDYVLSVDYEINLGDPPTRNSPGEPPHAEIEAVRLQEITINMGQTYCEISRSELLRPAKADMWALSEFGDEIEREIMRQREAGVL